MFAFLGSLPHASADNSSGKDSSSWHRGLWEGSLDRASDQSGSAARQLEAAVDAGCDHLLPQEGATVTEESAQEAALAHEACLRQAKLARKQAKEARSIQSQQKLLSVVSKASDVAAVGAVGAVIYSELGVKKNTPNNPDSQISSYEKAARIQRIAGQASYVTGATDLTIGAYSYVAHKNRLEKMQREAAKAGDSSVKSSLANAAEASKQAAYKHMMYGAGKMAAGYATMYLAKRSEKQAQKMVSIEEDKAYQQWLLEQQQANAAANQVAAYQNTAPVGGMPPYYFNNEPVITIPGASGQSTRALSELGEAGNQAISAGTGGGTGASVAPTGLRGTASAAGSKLTSSGGGAPSGGGPAPSASPEESAAESGKEKSTQEALSGFEVSLTGGHRAYQGGDSQEPAKDDATALLGAALGDNRSAATGLNPNQVYNAALEGTEGTEQGTMAGVNGKREDSLFVITRQKITKMYQVGNVGIPQTVEVK